VNTVISSKFNERQFLNQMFLVSKTIRVFELSLVVFESVKGILVLSANKLGVDLLFTSWGKSFIHKRNSSRPKMETCGSPCFV